MAIKTLTTKQLTWTNIDHIDTDVLQYLKKHFNFHHLDFEDIQSEQQSSKLDAYKNYLFLVLQFPVWQTETQVITANETDVFLGEGYLITIQHAKSKALKNFFYRCMNNRKIKADWMSGSAGYLLYRIIEASYENTRPILNNMGKQLSQVEHDIFSGEPDTSVIKQLATHRRNVLQFRRIVEPQRQMISALSHTQKPFLEEQLGLYFDDVADHVNKLWAIVETYKETIDGLHVTVESLLNRRINKLITVLTVFSVSMLPLTLLTGFYGMNINLPFQQQPGVVWVMFALLTAVIFVVILLLRRQRWI